jgi:hypothetical protein
MGVTKHEDPMIRVTPLQKHELGEGLTLICRVLLRIVQRAVCDHDSSGCLGLHWQSFEIASRFITEDRSGPSHGGTSERDAPLVREPSESHQVVVAEHANRIEASDHFNAFVRVGPVSDEVAGDDEPVDRRVLEAPQRRLKSRQVRMDVGQNA